MRITEVMAGQYQQQKGQHDKRQKRLPTRIADAKESSCLRLSDKVSISETGLELEQVESERELVRSYLQQLNIASRDSARIRHRIFSDSYDVAKVIDHLVTKSTDSIL